MCICSWNLKERISARLRSETRKYWIGASRDIYMVDCWITSLQSCTKNSCKIAMYIILLHGHIVI